MERAEVNKEVEATQIRKGKGKEMRGRDGMGGMEEGRREGE